MFIIINRLLLTHVGTFAITCRAVFSRHFMAICRRRGHRFRSLTRMVKKKKNRSRNRNRISSGRRFVFDYPTAISDAKTKRLDRFGDHDLDTETRPDLTGHSKLVRRLSNVSRSKKPAGRPKPYRSSGVMSFAGNPT